MLNYNISSITKNHISVEIAGNNYVIHWDEQYKSFNYTFRQIIMETLPLAQKDKEGYYKFLDELRETLEPFISQKDNSYMHMFSKFNIAPLTASLGDLDSVFHHLRRAEILDEITLKDVNMDDFVMYNVPSTLRYNIISLHYKGELIEFVTPNYLVAFNFHTKAFFSLKDINKPIVSTAIPRSLEYGKSVHKEDLYQELLNLAETNGHLHQALLNMDVSLLTSFLKGEVYKKDLSEGIDIESTGYILKINQRYKEGKINIEVYNNGHMLILNVKEDTMSMSWDIYFHSHKRYSDLLIKGFRIEKLGNLKTDLNMYKGMEHLCTTRSLRIKNLGIDYPDMPKDELELLACLEGFIDPTDLAERLQKMERNIYMFNKEVLTPKKLPLIPIHSIKSIGRVFDDLWGYRSKAVTFEDKDKFLEKFLLIYSKYEFTDFPIGTRLRDILLYQEEGKYEIINIRYVSSTHIQVNTLTQEMTFYLEEGEFVLTHIKEKGVERKDLKDYYLRGKGGSTYFIFDYMSILYKYEDIYEAIMQLRTYLGAWKDIIWKEPKNFYELIQFFAEAGCMNNKENINCNTPTVKIKFNVKGEFVFLEYTSHSGMNTLRVQKTEDDNYTLELEAETYKKFICESSLIRSVVANDFYFDYRNKLPI